MTWVPVETPGGAPFQIGEPFESDPRVAPGFNAPVGWMLRKHDGTAAFLKIGLGDTDWASFADLGGGLADKRTVFGFTSPDVIDLTHASTGNLIVPPVPGQPFLPLRLQLYTQQANGTMTSEAIIRIMNGSTEILAPTSDLTSFAAFAAGSGGLTQDAPASGTLSINAPTTLDVLTPATGTGTFIYAVRAIVSGFYL